jgi:1,5-anhydro-D-fructose reductase (1,5-anhydro-D-mannitol-forming)
MALGWGIIGIGKLADIAIAPAMGKQGASQLAAVCSRDLGRARQFAERHEARSAYDDYGQMLDDPAVDIVYIASPNALHAEHTVAAVQAGKHVLVEKPMALSVTDGQVMVDAASSAGVTLAVGFHLRHKATALMAREAVRSGRLGRVFLADMSVGAGKSLYPYHTWRADPLLAGGGTLLHQGTHAIDLIAFLTDRTISEVTCQLDITDADEGEGERQRAGGRGSEDVFTATCRLDDGTLATLSSHQLHAGTRPDWALFGEEGWLACRGGSSPFPGDELTFHVGREEPSALATSEVSAYDAEVDAFVAAVEGTAVVNGSGLDGLRVIAACEALYRSARERRTVAVETVGT